MVIEGQIEESDTETGVSGLLKAVSPLLLLGQKPAIQPLYGKKRRDKDDGIRGVGRSSRYDICEVQAIRVSRYVQSTFFSHL